MIKGKERSDNNEDCIANNENKKYHEIGFRSSF